MLNHSYYSLPIKLIIYSTRIYTYSYAWISYMMIAVYAIHFNSYTTYMDDAFLSEWLQSNTVHLNLSTRMLYFYRHNFGYILYYRFRLLCSPYMYSYAALLSSWMTHGFSYMQCYPLKLLCGHYIVCTLVLRSDRHDSSYML